MCLIAGVAEAVKSFTAPVESFIRSSHIFRPFSSHIAEAAREHDVGRGLVANCTIRVSVAYAGITASEFAESTHSGCTRLAVKDIHDELSSVQVT